MNRNCNHCHDCGAKLEKCLDGEEFCPNCQAYHRYKSHGWGWQGEGDWKCPELLALVFSPEEIVVTDDVTIVV